LFGRIVTAIEPHAITVPVAALVPAAGGEGFQVFVVDSGDVVHVRPVTVGGRSEAVAEIVAGVVAGEVVVKNGAYGIADGARHGRLPVAHRHGVRAPAGARPREPDPEHAAGRLGHRHRAAHPVVVPNHLVQPRGRRPGHAVRHRALRDQAAHLARPRGGAGGRA